MMTSENTTIQAMLQFGSHQISTVFCLEQNFQNSIYDNEAGELRPEYKS
jgi:hypothetical protein